MRGVAQRSRRFMSDKMALADRRGRGGPSRKRDQEHRRNRVYEAYYHGFMTLARGRRGLPDSLGARKASLALGERRFGVRVRHACGASGARYREAGDLRDCPARPVQGGERGASSFQGADVGLPCRATSAPASDTSSEQPRRPAVLLYGSVAPSDFGNLVCSIACRRGGRAVLPSP